MKPENVKFLFQTFIECKQNQDEIDGPGDISVEYDNPTQAKIYAEGLITWEAQSSVEASSDLLSSIQYFPLGSAPAVPIDVITTGRDLVRMAHKFSTAQPDKSIVKFKEICMITEPIQQTVSICVLRDQSFSQNKTTVSWKTSDKTALTGIHYVGSNGEIVFNEGETNKDIKIQILNSADDSSVDDLRFTVELSCGVYSPRPVTISLKKISNLDPSEQMVLHNLPRSLPFTVSDVKYALDRCLNARTFHMALTHLCSTNNDVGVQIALALELGSLCLQKSSGSSMPIDTIIRVLSNFLRRDDYKRWN